MTDLGVPGGAVHGLDLADLVPALRRQVDEERRVRRLGHVGVVLGAGDEDGEVGPMGVGDEPLVAVEHPLLAVLHAVGADEGGVGAGDLGLGHGEARPGPAVAERAQVALLLLVGAPVQQGVHVALVGGLAVQHPRAQAGAGGLGLHHGQLDVAEAHAAPLGGHVGQPEPLGEGLLPEASEGGPVGLAVGLLQPFLGDAHLGGADDVVDERADPAPELLELGGEAEVDAHGQESGTPPLPETVRCPHAGAWVRRTVSAGAGLSRRRRPRRRRGRARGRRS